MYLVQRRLSWALLSKLKKPAIAGFFVSRSVFISAYFLNGQRRSLFSLRIAMGCNCCASANCWKNWAISLINDCNIGLNLTSEAVRMLSGGYVIQYRQCRSVCRFCYKKVERWWGVVLSWWAPTKKPAMMRASYDPKALSYREALMIAFNSLGLAAITSPCS